MRELMGIYPIKSALNSYILFFLTMAKMHIYYDAEGDYMEVRFGQPRESFYEYLGKDTFKRIDKKTKKVFGCAFYNVKKREHKSPQNIEVDTPLVS